MDLNLFYSVLAGATATLLGLLFIAIQPNIGRLFSDPQGRGKALAVSTFQTYGQLLVVCLFTFTVLLRAEVIVLAAVLGIWRQLRTWLPVWRLTARAQIQRLTETFWVFVAPALLDVWLIYSATRLQQGKGDEGTETNIAVALVVLLVIVLRNSWQLLIEIPSEEAKQSQGS